MNVLFLVPNYLVRDDFGDPTDPPIGVVSIAAVLEQGGYEVAVIDANAENLNDDQVIARIGIFLPDVVGISCNYAPLHNSTLEIARRIKAEVPCLVVVGGNHATAMADFLMKASTSIDVIVRGEGEVIFPRLLETLGRHEPLDTVRGLTFRNADKIVCTQDAELGPNLDEFPLPAYHLLPMNIYNRYNIISSRGCPFDCSYCASNTIFGRKVRYRSPAAVAQEIEHLMHTYGKKHFWFSDDTFTSNPAYTHLLLDELISRRLEISWSCLTRVNRVDAGLLKKMKLSGCAYISYGIESGSQEMLKKIGKNLTCEEILSALELTHQAGIRQYGFFIVGFPGETRETIMDSYKLIYRSRLDGAAFNILIPLPGTRIMHELKSKGLLKLEEIKWDYLFARTVDESYVTYAAELASKWSDVSARELIEACKIGHNLPEIFRYVKEGER